MTERKGGKKAAQVVVVTGASAGVGRAVAHRYAADGARIGLIARDEVALAEVVREVGERGGAALALPCDVADADAVFAAAERAERELGPIDLWINDAMVTVFSPVHEIAPEEFRRVTEVCYLGFVHGSMAALRHMRPRRRGTILQVGSALGYRGVPLQAAYCGAKHAIRGFTESLRAEIEHDRAGVRVTIVELPAVNTPQFDWARAHTDYAPRPMGAPVEPAVIADAVHRAARGWWREYWLGRSAVLVTLGNFVAPGLLDRFMARNAVAGQLTDKRIPPDAPDNLESPLHGPHRTSGSFGDETGAGATLYPAPLTRAGVVALGALAFFGLGAACARAGQARPGIGGRKA